MRSSFTAKIYKVGINPCVEVPFRITKKMTPSKGYIRVKGKIGNHTFHQTLVPVRNEGYRLYVNGPMLKGSGLAVGGIAAISIEQDLTPAPDPMLTMPTLFKEQLMIHNLQGVFDSLIPSRKKEILQYLNYLKTEAAVSRNVDKLMTDLKRSRSLRSHTG